MTDLNQRQVARQSPACLDESQLCRVIRDYERADYADDEFIQSFYCELARRHGVKDLTSFVEVSRIKNGVVRRLLLGHPELIVQVGSMNQLADAPHKDVIKNLRINFAPVSGDCERFRSVLQEYYQLNKIDIRGLYFPDLVLACFPQTIKNLNVSFCLELSNTGLEYIKQQPLRELNLSNCGQITNDGLKYLSEMPLETLNLSACRRITDTGLKHLEGLPLTSLDLNGCIRITDAGLEHLMDLPLETLALRYTRVSRQGVNYFRRKHPSIEVSYND